MPTGNFPAIYFSPSTICTAKDPSLRITESCLSASSRFTSAMCSKNEKQGYQGPSWGSFK
jgi:hypothetical protein